MKILIIGQRIYWENDPVFSKQMTGLSRMVAKVAEEAAETGNDVYFFGAAFTPAKTLGSIHVIERSRRSLFRHARPIDYLRAVEAFFQHRGSLSARAKSAYFALSRGHLNYILRKHRFGVVNIHSVSPFTYQLQKEVMHAATPYVLSLHGVINAPEVVAPKWQKRVEQLAIEKASSCHAPITVVSTGSKRFFINHYRCNENDFIVAPNDTDILYAKAEEIVLPLDKRIVTYVGNATPRKNQHLLLEALTRLSKDELSDVVIAFAGDSHELPELAERLGVMNRCLFLGPIKQGQLAYLYSRSALNLLLSKSEGFGLSIIEAAQFGVPSLVSSTIDSVEDITSPATALVIEPKTEDIVAGLRLGLQKEWDHEPIIELSKRFAAPMMLGSYLKAYKTAISKRKENRQELERKQ